MSEPEKLRVLNEIRDLQRVIAQRQKTIVITNVLLIVLGVAICAAFLLEIYVVIRVLSFQAVHPH